MSATDDPVIAAISADLRGRRSVRWRRLCVGLLGVVGVLIVLYAMMGVRDDLLARAPWRVVADVIAWVIALVVIPPVAVGLWHPRRMLVASAAAIAGGLVAIAAVDLGRVGTEASAAGCEIAVAVATVPMVIALAIAGAWSQARARGAAVWTAVATAMVGFVGVDWMCAQSDLRHVLLGHLLPALGAAALVWAIGRARRRGVATAG